MNTGPATRLSSDRVLRVVDDAKWDTHLASLEATDTYSCAAYHRASALLEPEGTRPVLLAFGDEGGDLALPLLLRPLPDGEGWDATSAYGYGGPIGHGSPDLNAFGAALNAWATEHGVVCTFLRLNPLLHNDWLVPPTAQVIDAGSTVGWDLSPGRDLRQRLQPARRGAVRRAERAGVTVSVTYRPSNLEHFRALYDATMQRQQATDFYFFPDTYWQALVSDDPLLVPLLIEARLGDRVIHALLCFVSDRWLHFHLGGGDELSREVNGSVACFVAAAEWGQARGLTCFHLGGGLGGSKTSSLYAFKQRFDPDSTPLKFQVAKLVHDRDRYRQLAGSDDIDGFFPAWRRPR
ncbi:GNAT family N-acetyltransferase [Arthrobacter sp. W4I7]|uniref:GNAT family N-acetyltransferase n=1 Tax=Arthrobacter sp. W4I7 TaxID=3042296 RepID=UPI00278455F9|nr:GNAT family N-acetyltransferase [Arthrobacter sp. W4I7]MDQ0689884.1 serine/alanine adding enzyme [Arthrobacter sp. W4I7]